MSEIRLRQLSDGKWYKFGAGKPVEATAEEIALWETALEVVSEGVELPTAPKGRLGDLAKWGALFIAITTLLVLLLDWGTVVAWCRALGVPHLAYAMFAEELLRSIGLQQFLTVLSEFGVALVVLYLPPYFLSIEISRPGPSVRVLGTVAMCAILVVALSLVPVGSESERVLINAQRIGLVAIAAWIIIGEIGVDATKRANLIKAVPILLAVPALVSQLLFSYPAALGQEYAADLLTGRRHLPTVEVMITKDVLALSREVSARQLGEDRWAYGALFVEMPDSERKVPSLQYVGQAEDSVYVFDFTSASVHAVPRDSIVELAFAVSLDGSWWVPEVSVPN